MPTDTSAGSPSEGGAPQPEEADDLVFAAHDLGRDRPTPEPRADEDAAFAQAPRPSDAAPPPDVPSVAAAAPTRDSFVIRDPVDAAPAAPVDALVVGAPAPAPAPGAIVPRDGFRIHSSPLAPADGPREAPLPWTVRDPEPDSESSRRGWTSRESGKVECSAQDTVRRLREDAVHVSWKSAWLAVKSADNRLFKRGQG